MVLALLSLPLALCLALPFAALVAYNSPQDWVRGLTSVAALQALGLTLRTTFAAVFLCVVFGLPVAVLLARFNFRAKAALDILVDLPIMIPPVVVGVALLLAFGRYGIAGRYLTMAGIELPFSTAAVVMAQFVMAVPFFVRAARAGFETVDSKLEDSARVLGATRWEVFRTISLPLAMPSLAAGTVLAWARALSEFGATMMFAGSFPGRTQTLALAVMSGMESDLKTAVSIAGLSLFIGLTALTATRAMIGRWNIPSG